jgi:hypothetical protein
MFWKLFFSWLRGRIGPRKRKRRLEIAWTESDRIKIWENALSVAPKEGAVIALCSRSTGKRRETIIIRHPIAPAAGYLSYKRGSAVTINARYWNAVLDILTGAPEGSGIAVLHTHPGPGVPSWSSDDNIADQNLARFLFGEGFLKSETPLVSLVGSKTHLEGRELIYDQARDRIEMRPVERIRCIAPDHFTLLVTSEMSNGASREAVPDYADRSIRVFGREGQKLLANLHVAVIGNGGVGSIVAEQLARMGIGTLSLWDPDIVKPENINRSAIFTSADADRGIKKVKALAKALPAVSLVRDIKIFASEQDVRLPSEIGSILDADLIVMLVDDVRPRHFVNQLAYAHYIPVFDGGNAIRSTGEHDGTSEQSFVEDGGVRVSLVFPGMPCLWCAGHITPQKLGLAFRSSEDIAADRARGYVENLESEQAPSVMPVNLLTAALVAIRFQDFLYKLSGRPIPEVHFSLKQNTLDELPRSQKPTCSQCVSREGLGDSAKLDFSEELSS